MAKEIYNKSGTSYSVPFVFKITSSVANAGTETISVENDYTLVKETKGGGFTTEQIDYIISGTISFNEATTIGTLKVEALSNYFFPTSPYLETKFSDNIKLLLTKVEKDSTRTNKNINIYTFSIIYQNKERTTRASGLTAKLKYNSKAINARTCAIHNVSFGSFTIPMGGSTRPIKIQGTPSATFGIAVNENVIDATGPIHKHNDTSILTSSIANSTTTYNYGKTINIIKGTTSADGTFEFNQKFPSSNFYKQLTAAASTSRDIVLDDVDDLAVGDTLHVNDNTKFAYGATLTRYTIGTITTATKTVRLADSATITLADKTRVSFSRKKSYSIDIIPDLTCALGSTMPTTDPTYRLTQYNKTVVRFELFTSGTAFTITQLNDVNTGLSAGNEHYFYYAGEANRNIVAKIDLNYKLVAASGGFTTIRYPIFNSFIGYDATGRPTAAQTDGGSDWTNSVFRENGGTEIFSNGAKFTLSTASSSNDTCHLHFTGYIKRFGDKDVNLVLDLDKILNIS